MASSYRTGSRNTNSSSMGRSSSNTCELPYMAEWSAEDNEPIFDDFKNFLLPERPSVGSVDDMDPSKDLLERFTWNDALILMHVRYLMTTKMKARDYSSDWITDFSEWIQQYSDPDVECEWVNDPYFLTLLCIDETTFHDTPIVILESLVSDLRVTAYIGELLEGPFKESNDDDLFPKLRSSLLTGRKSAAKEPQEAEWGPYADKKLILLCQIFLARVYVYLKMQEDDEFAVLNGTHFDKCNKYLQVLERHVVLVAPRRFPDGSSPKRSNNPCRRIEKVCPQTGRVIQVFRSWTDIQDSEGESINPSHLTAHLHGRTAMYQGYVWRYARPEPNHLKRKVHQNKCRQIRPESDDESYDNSPPTGAPGTDPKFKIEKICPESDEVVAAFYTKESLLESLNLDKFPYRLTAHLKGRDELYRGYKWRGENVLPVRPPDRPIEQVCPETGEVICVFGSMSKVRSVYENASPLYAILSSKKPKNSMFCGFNWRYAGEQGQEDASAKGTIPPRASQGPADRSYAWSAGRRNDNAEVFQGMDGESDKYSYATDCTAEGESNTSTDRKNLRFYIEKICPESDEVVAAFYTKESLLESLGLERLPDQLRAHLKGKKELYKGYKWRGENVLAVPPPDRPVEQVCPETGEVICVFGSVSKVKSVYNHISNLCAILNGRRPNSKFNGFHWRYAADKKPAGSERTVVPPPDETGTRKRSHTSLEEGEDENGHDNTQSYQIEKVCPETGDVLEVFTSWEDIRDSLGVSRNPSQLISHLSGSVDLYQGFRWRCVKKRKPNKVNPEYGANSIPDEVVIDESDESDSGISNHRDEDSDYENEVVPPKGGTNQYRIEKICPMTGKVVEAYASKSALIRSLRLKSFPSALSNHLAGKEELFRGYKWRCEKTVVYATSALQSTQGDDTVSQDMSTEVSHSLPSQENQTRTRCALRRIVKVCPTTGHVLDTYDTKVSVARSFGNKEFSEGLTEALEGRRKLYKGFCWKWVDNEAH